MLGYLPNVSKSLIKLVCKQEKINDRFECTVYDNDEKWFKCDEETANDIIQKNKAKEFETYESKYYYFEVYTF